MGEVYSLLESLKRTAMGGREADVGLSGFLLGGMWIDYDDTKQDLSYGRRVWTVAEHSWHRSKWRRQLRGKTICDLVVINTNKV